MRFRTLLAVLSLTIPMAACMHNTKAETANDQCRRLIAQAQKLNAHQTHRDRIDIQVTNLITAAKISDEKQEYISCIDQASRAIELLNPNSVLTVQSAH